MKKVVMAALRGIMPIFIAAASVPPTFAEQVRFDLSGVVTGTIDGFSNPLPFSSGDTFSASFILESPTVQSPIPGIPGSSATEYQAGFVTAGIGNYVVCCGPGIVTLFDNFGDRIEGGGQGTGSPIGALTFQRFGFHLGNTAGSVFQGPAFLTPSLSLQSFNENTFDFLFTDPASNRISPEAFGRLTTISVTAVPLPAAIWLFGSGLVAVMGLARRNMHRGNVEW